MPESPTRESDPVRCDVSAGGVVARCTQDARIEVVLCGRSATGLRALPKGTPLPNESREETALREVQEETGLRATILKSLGSVRYVFRRDGVLHRKQVFHYLMEPVGGSIDDHDAEYDIVEWAALNPATLGTMTYDTDVIILKRAIRAMAPQAGSNDDAGS